MDISQEWILRFNAKWKKDEATGCWVWTAAQASKGYGEIKIPKTRRQIPAHCLSYLIHRGPIPAGTCVLHSCDNPPCVNPEHLFLGTKKDNAMDMVSKKRHLYGQMHPNSKLTEAQVLKILSLIAAGLPQVMIAQMYHVNQMLISRIKHGERWAHLQPDRPKWRKERVFVTQEQAAEILRHVNAGESQYSIASQFGVSQAHVSRLVNGKVSKFGGLPPSK